MNTENTQSRSGPTICSHGPDLATLARLQHEWLQSVGWTKTNALEDLALVASEVGEAVNECRGEQISNGFAFELADIILRVLGIAEKNGIDIEAAVCHKMALNKERGTRGRLK